MMEGVPVCQYVPFSVCLSRSCVSLSGGGSDVVQRTALISRLSPSLLVFFLPTMLTLRNTPLISLTFASVTPASCRRGDTLTTYLPARLPARPQSTVFSLDPREKHFLHSCQSLSLVIFVNGIYGL